MAFWLADSRKGQDSDWIQRFDPRFWTVNYPRPMVATIVSTAPMPCESKPASCARPTLAA